MGSFRVLVPVFLALAYAAFSCGGSTDADSDGSDLDADADGDGGAGGGGQGDADADGDADIPKDEATLYCEQSQKEASDFGEAFVKKIDECDLTLPDAGAATGEQPTEEEALADCVALYDCRKANSSPECFNSVGGMLPGMFSCLLALDCEKIEKLVGTDFSSIDFSNGANLGTFPCSGKVAGALAPCVNDLQKLVNQCLSGG